MMAQFALRLICGLSTAWCVMPRAQITSGYFRIQMLLALALGVLATLTCAQLASLEQGTAALGIWSCRGAAMAMSLVAFAGSVLWTLERRLAGRNAAMVLAALATLVLLAVLPWRSASIGGTWLALSSATDLASAWLLGTAVSTMLLGHWYLTATGMPLSPLIRMNHVLLGIILLRGVLAAVGFVTAPAVGAELTHTAWLILRWLGGLAGPLFLCGLVRRILRFRNTQAATGVLFAIVILSLLGETTAMLLARDFSWPM